MKQVRFDFLDQGRPHPPVQRVCVVCGKPAMHGYGVAIRKGREGRWFCGEHKPK